FNHGADHLRMLAHAKVIVRAPDHDRASAAGGMPRCVRETACDALEIRKHAIAPLLVQASKRGGKQVIIDHGATLRSSIAIVSFTASAAFIKPAEPGPAECPEVHCRQSRACALPIGNQPPRL